MQELDVVADGVGGEEAVDAAGREQLFGDDPVEERLRRRRRARACSPCLRVRGCADSFPSVPRCGRTATSRCTRAGVGRAERLRLHADAGERRCRDILGAPVDAACGVGAGFLNRRRRLAVGACVALAKRFVLGAMVALQSRRCSSGSAGCRHRHGAACVEHVDDGSL